MKQLLTLIMVVGIAINGIAQDSKVITAEVNYNKGDYAEAVSNLDIALADMNSLSDKNKPKAFYYRAKSNYMLLLEAAKNQDHQALAQIDILLIHEDYKNALKFDDGKWGTKVKTQQIMLRNILLESGLSLITANNNMEAEKYLQASAEIEEDYMVNDLIGQAKLNQKKFVEAETHFIKSIMQFKDNPPTKPDMLIAYVYYRSAMISAYYSGDYDKYYDLYTPTKVDVQNAHVRLKDGLEKLETEWGRYQKVKSEYTDESWSQIELQYGQIKSDLELFQLDVYLQYPINLEESIGKMEEALVKDPENYIITVGLGQLLEKKDMAKAKETYLKAIDINPAEELANFNYGSLIFNDAIQVIQESNEVSNMKESDALYKQGIEKMNESKPYFEAALKANPYGMESIRALKQIAMNNDNMEDYSKYKKMETELGY